MTYTKPNTMFFSRYIKAGMNSDIPLKRQSYFFLANLVLKQGISSEYVILDFFCIGLLDLSGVRT